MTQRALAAIPQPPTTFLLRHMRALNATRPIQDMVTLARAYGPIYQLDMRRRVLIVVSGYNLVQELCDDKRFDKSIHAALGLVRRRLAHPATSFIASDSGVIPGQCLWLRMSRTS